MQYVLCQSTTLGGRIGHASWSGCLLLNRERTSFRTCRGDHLRTCQKLCFCALMPFLFFRATGFQDIREPHPEDPSATSIRYKRFITASRGLLISCERTATIRPAAANFSALTKASSAFLRAAISSCSCAFRSSACSVGLLALHLFVTLFRVNKSPRRSAASQLDLQTSVIVSVQTRKRKSAAGSPSDPPEPKKQARPLGKAEPSRNRCNLPVKRAATHLLGWCRANLPALVERWRLFKASCSIARKTDRPAAGHGCSRLSDNPTRILTVGVESLPTHIVTKL